MHCPLCHLRTSLGSHPTNIHGQDVAPGPLCPGPGMDDFEVLGLDFDALGVSLDGIRWLEQLDWDTKIIIQIADNDPLCTIQGHSGEAVQYDSATMLKHS